MSERENDNWSAVIAGATRCPPGTPVPATPLVDKGRAMELEGWREFSDGEEWFAGRALWLWAPSWEKPRLATADRGDDFEWFYASGPKLEDADWEFPTHCCDPMPPTPPAV